LCDFGIKDPKSGMRRSECRLCCRERSKQHYRRNRAAYLNRNRQNNPVQRQRGAELVRAFLLEHPCLKCGESDLVVLEFNHVNSQTKLGNISDMVLRGCSEARLNAEIAKCEVLCANCHQRLTSLSRPYHYKSHPLPPAESTLKSFRRAANARNQQIAFDYLSSASCADCGQRDPLVLQFDHIEAKANHVSWLVGSGCSSSRLLQELAKCIVRCANCHRRRTAQAGGWFRTRSARPGPL
jgi:hypothetical protein